jgi:tRNA(Ile)-lysidine synthase
LREWRRLELPVSNETIVVAVSGGADSAALLLALDELIKAGKLKLRVVVAHVDHQLRKTSKDDARWVKGLAENLNYSVSIKRVVVRTERDNLEQSARIARYKSLAALAQEQHAKLVLTAHTMDDQAETVLLNLLRGSGADGLSGMEPVRSLDRKTEARLARPLLSWARRSDTERYCGDREIEFRRDEMNEDETFARVRVRRQLLPLMQSFNPRIVEALTRTADLMRQDSDALDGAARRLLEVSRAGSAASAKQLRADVLALAPPALRRRALRLWLEQCRGDLRRLELVHVQAVANLTTDNRGGRTIELPGGSTVSFRRGLLTFNGRTSARAKA